MTFETISADHERTTLGQAGPDRPSRSGAILGRALAALASAGREIDPTLPDTCATCAFRPGCMPNQTGGTGILAFNCAVGIDDAPFGCHHGLKDGEPTKLCAGYAAAMLAPFEFAREVMTGVVSELDGMIGPDEVRAEYDAWQARVDPEGAMDVYQLARAYERCPLSPETAHG